MMRPAGLACVFDSATPMGKLAARHQAHCGVNKPMAAPSARQGKATEKKLKAQSEKIKKPANFSPARTIAAAVVSATSLKARDVADDAFRVVFSLPVVVEACACS